jgi:uncharacterized repeat protein (TIGR01451 family)
MMSARYITRRLVGLVALFVSVAWLVCAGSASAEGLAPWWGVSSAARPSELEGSPGSDEVYELTVSASGGSMVLVSSEPGGVKLVPWNASAEVLQEALEELYPEAETLPNVVVPARRVGVSGGPGDEGGTKPYVIRFPGQSVKSLSAVGAFLTGTGASAALVEKQAGVDSEDQVVVSAQNLGDAATSGRVVISDVLPAGLEAVSISSHGGGTGRSVREFPVCVVKSLTCVFGEGSGAPGLNVLPPFEELEVRIGVVPKAGAKAGEVNVASVSGGGALSGRTDSHVLRTGEPRKFGIEEARFVPENAGGSFATQAGSHPFQVTGSVTFNSQTADRKGNPRAVALAKSVVSELPVGVIGNPTPFAQCTDAQFAAQAATEEGGAEVPISNECPAASAIGVATVTINEPNAEGLDTATTPIFNMVPRPGEPARFGLKAAGIFPAFLDASVRTGSDYGVTVTAEDITQIAWLLKAKLTFWGVPGDPRHDHQRGWECLESFGSCPETKPSSPPPFLAMPTSCGQPFRTMFRSSSWGSSAAPAERGEPVSYTLPEAVDGCNHLPFTPSIKVTPDGTAGSSPSGLAVDVHVPQNAILNSESLAESDLQGLTVALPEGVAVNPAGGDGLGACGENLAGFTGVSEGKLAFTPTLPTPLEPGKNFCPDDSKIGTVDIASPLLPAGQHVKGAVYIATQNQNPFGSLIAMYIIAEDPISGVVVKQSGEVHLTETGQIVTTFNDVPQLAFEDAELHFFGGERAPLTTPAHCGTYTTSAAFVPWSGNESTSSSSSFNITTGPSGTPCPGAALPFSPTLAAGTTNIQAGALTSLTTTLGREDGQQDLQSVQIHMPPGLSGLLTSVKLCPEAQANEGTCGPESLIGETTVSAGVGSDPVTVTGGKVYITEKYAGAPFGLSIVNPVKAGPFDLENTPNQHPACDCLVVRAKIEIDPQTTALTVTTDPSGPHAIPHIIEGIPVQIKHVNVTINRPDFTFNPTNCDPLKITSTITSIEGAAQNLSLPFQVTNCATLGFKPSFKVSTSGATSKSTGASLKVNVIAPSQGPQAAATASQPAKQQEANIKSVKVSLPIQLPSRLKPTIQNACPEAVFNVNPAECQAKAPDSLVGMAIAHTPILDNPLVGPAYLVSHGGLAFPNIEIVLQGEGIVVDLVGNINIKKSITTSEFKAVPDAPISTFELNLPEGPHSALAAPGGNLCGQKLIMPTEIVGQNGAVENQQTRIEVEGCSNALVVKSKKLGKAGKTLSLKVEVPAAGKLVASGKGVGSVSKSSSGREFVSMNLTLSKKDAAKVAKHEKVKVKVKLAFTPTKGKKLSKSFAATYKAKK